MDVYSIGIVNASSLLGKELGTALRERRFPALTPRLLQAPAADGATTEPRLTEFEEEAAVAEPFQPEQLDDLDVVFLTGEAADARRAWSALAEDDRRLVVDLTGGLAEEPGARLAGLDPLNDSQNAPLGTEIEAGRLIVVAHPAAQGLAYLLERAGKAGRVESASAVVFEPASERGMAGMQELEQQSARTLALQPLPEAVYGAQVAFNLRASLGAGAEPSLEGVRRRIERQLGALLRDGGAPAIELLQAPIFHACVISLHLRYAGGVATEAVEASLASPWIARSREYPDVIAAAGEDAIQLGPVRADAAGGCWLFATLDNLRRTAFSAVDAAAAALRQRGPR